MEKKLHLISRDAQGRFGCRWLIATDAEAAREGYAQPGYSRSLTPGLRTYLISLGLIPNPNN